MNIKDALDSIMQQDESIFPMDSFPGSNEITDDEEDERKKKRQVIRTVYPESESEDVEIKRVMIDLDGTIHRYRKGYADGTLYDKAYKGAKEVIDWLKKKGFEIVIFTARLSDTTIANNGLNKKEILSDIQSWLNEHDIYYDKITAEKLPAEYYIDDRAIPIKNGNWKKVFETLKENL